MICLPELVTTSLRKGNMVELAEPIPGETTEKMEELALENNMFIAGSSSHSPTFKLDESVSRTMEACHKC